MDAYQADTSTCPRAVLGSVATSLPEAARDAVAQFYDQLEDWVTRATDGHEKPMPPKLVISLLQGAMVMSQATGDTAALKDVRRLLAQAR